MVNKIISEGIKIDIKDILNSTQKADGIVPNVYASQVLDVSKDGRLRISMPFIRGRLVPLAKEREYEAYFYAAKSIYFCKMVVIERYKTGNVYSMEIELTTKLEKQQRRQFYRLEKNMSIEYGQLSDSVAENVLMGNPLPDTYDVVYNKGETLDISGGGARFVGRTVIDRDKVILFKLGVVVDKKSHDFTFPAKVVMSFSTNQGGMFEHRVEFLNLNNTDRDILVRYIFEEERKYRKKSR